MIARTLSILFAATALVGAVLYAQKKANENPQVRPVFETSKSGTPTPIEDAPPKKPVKKNEIKQGEEVKQQADEPAQQQKSKKKKKKVMPTSKSYIPD